MIPYGGMGFASTLDEALAALVEKRCAEVLKQNEALKAKQCKMAAEAALGARIAKAFKPGQIYFNTHCSMITRVLNEPKKTDKFTSLQVELEQYNIKKKQWEPWVSEEIDYIVRAYVECPSINAALMMHHKYHQD